jgi:predicted porin
MTSKRDFFRALKLAVGDSFISKNFCKEESMKRLILAIAIAAIFATGSVVYAGQFGPPEPAAKEGKTALGVGYFYYSAKIKPENTVNFKERVETQNQTYLQAGYGFAKNMEAYLRVGGADVKIKKAFDFDSPKDFKDGLKPFGTIGVKGVFDVTPSFGIGPFLQASLYSSYEDKKTGAYTGDTYTDTVKFKNQREINLGIGLQGKIGDAVIYGGPVAYWTKAKMEASSIGEVAGDIWTFSTTYKEKNNIGGFAGVRVPLTKSLNLEVEGQMKSRFSFGGSLTYAF